jgi:hypothetical protein
VLRPLLRRLAEACERLPGIRRFGVSQALVAERLADNRQTSDPAMA